MIDTSEWRHMTFRHEMVQLGSDRAVGVHIAGDLAANRVVLLCHPAPGSGAFDPDPTITKARGVALVAVDRPGYGASEPRPSAEWSTVAGAADDALEVLDALGVGRVSVAGWSAGGRVALAMAAARPDAVDRVAVCATPAPDDEVPWLAPEVRAGIEALRGLEPGAARAALRDQLGPLIPEPGSESEALALLGVSDADEAALGIAGDRIGEMLSAAFAKVPRVWQLTSPATCCSLPGFEPSEVAAKTLLLYGSADPITGPRHGKWWQRALQRPLRAGARRRTSRLHSDVEADHVPSRAESMTSRRGVCGSLRPNYLTVEGRISRRSRPSVPLA